MTSIMDVATLTAGAAAQAGTAAAGGSAQPSSVHDIAEFRAAWDKAGTINTAAPEQAPQAPAESEGMRAVFSVLESLNGRAETLETKTAMIAGEDRDMTPGEMLMLTVQSHELLFHCELTANVANRTSDGIQQLFRQQG